MLQLGTQQSLREEALQAQESAHGTGMQKIVREGLVVTVAGANVIHKITCISKMPLAGMRRSSGHQSSQKWPD